jgi:hypothetical protein
VKNTGVVFELAELCTRVYLLLLGISWPSKGNTCNLSCDAGDHEKYMDMINEKR